MAQGEEVTANEGDRTLDVKLERLLFGREVFSVMEECSRHTEGARYVDGSGISGFDMWEEEIWLSVESSARRAEIEDEGAEWNMDTEWLGEYTSVAGHALEAADAMAARFGCQVELVRLGAVWLHGHSGAGVWEAVVRGGALSFATPYLSHSVRARTASLALTQVMVDVLTSQGKA